MTYPSDKEIIDLLNNDPLHSAEQMTGKSYKEDEATSSLGFMMNVYNNMAKEKTLKSIGDTVFNMDWLAYCEMIETFGFGLMTEDFSPDGGESIRVYYHEKDGLLLYADSYHGNRNGAKVYYNWQPNLKPKEEWKDPSVGEFVSYFEVTSSGGFYHPNHERNMIPDDVSNPIWKNVAWVGNHDAREALSFNLRRLREKGAFLPKWKKMPYMWLVGHWEKGDKVDYKSIVKNRIKRLPQWVQDNIEGIA